MRKKSAVGKKRRGAYPVKWLPASYTVEASWIMAISMGLLLFAVLCGYELFAGTLEDVTREGQEISCVELFRAAARGREMLN